MGDYVIYSDGGGPTGGEGAGACIIEQSSSGKREHLAVYLGRATNNEAEISAGLLGFSYLRFAQAKGRRLESVRWVSDSQYVLKSATEYVFNWQKNGWKTSAKAAVKNQALWRVYLQLSKGLKIVPEHVRGHTGHPENELCDEAVGWARTEGVSLLSETGEGRYPMADARVKWLLLDAQVFLKELRACEGGEIASEQAKFFISRFEEVLSARQGPKIVRHSPSSTSASKIPDPKNDATAQVIKLLKKAEKEALSCGAAGESLAKDISRIIKKNAGS